MKKSIKWITLCTAMISTIAFATPHPSVEKMASAWRATFEALIQAKEWEKAQTIAGIGEYRFAQQQWWQTPQFQQTWTQWLQAKAQVAWSADSNRLGIWRLSEGSNPNRPSIGFKKEQNGTWWLIVVDPSDISPTAVPGWRCPASCAVMLNTGQRSLTLTARPPLGQQWTTSSALGMVLPIQDLRDGQQIWTLHMPGASKPLKFDVSYARRACQQMLDNCF